MSTIRSVAVALLVALALASCSRDPNVAKRRYLESGNKYFDKGRYREASIQYRNAIKIDQRYGLAHYKMALVALYQRPQPDWGVAMRELRKAKELLPVSQQEHWDAVVKLAELYLGPMIVHEEAILTEVQGFCSDLLKRDPNSFDGHRLTGDLNYLTALDSLKVKKPDDARASLDAAMEEYRKAEAAKPGNAAVTIQIARGNSLSCAIHGLQVAGSIDSCADFGVAEQGYRGVLSKDPANFTAYRELYQVLLAQKKSQEAADLLLAGYKNNPKEFGFLISLAEQYLGENRRDEMLSVLQQIKSKAAEYSKAYFDVGDFYLRVGDGDAAIREFKEGIARDGKNKADYEKRIIEVLMRQGKRQEAARYTDQILKENPKDPDARAAAASMALDKGDVSKALTELQQVVTMSPTNAVAHYNLGRAYYLHGEAEQARQQFAKAIELNPQNTAARLATAQVQVTRREYDAAVRSALEVLRYDPNNKGAKLIQSAALMGAEKFAEARQVLNAMLLADPASPDAAFQLGVLNLAEKKYADAEAAFRRAYQLNPANARGFMGLVETYMAQNMTDKAIALLQAESAKTPSRLDFHLALGNVYVRAGRFDVAISEFQKVIAGTPAGSSAQGQIYLEIGETYRRKGDFAAAVSAFQEARKILPENEKALTALGMTLVAADRWPEARQIYEAIMKINPYNGIVLNNLAFGLAQHNGDLDQALTWAQQAKRLFPAMPEVADTLAWVYLKKNLPDEALTILQELVAKNPENAIFHYHLALAMAQKGDKSQAREQVKRALALNPVADEKKEIQEFLSRL